MSKIRDTLLDLIDHAYPDSENISQYKKFYIEMINKNTKSKHGDYHLRTHRIRIFNLHRDSSAIVATTIHELSHHIEFVDRKTTGHGPEFYERYQHLLYTALDMGLFDKEAFLAATRDASDTNKVRKMLASYIPHPCTYKHDMVTISVTNCYPVKDTLRGRGYQYQPVGKAWEKEILKAEVEKECYFLDKLSVNYQLRDAAKMIEKKQGIIAGKGSYAVKGALSKAGFHWDTKQKVWMLEAEETNAADLLAMYQHSYPDVEFQLVL